jgi:hypothetical protein
MALSYHHVVVLAPVPRCVTSAATRAVHLECIARAAAVLIKEAAAEAQIFSAGLEPQLV